MKQISTIILLVLLPFAFSCQDGNKKNEAAEETTDKMKETTDTWEVDFFDDFETFNEDNWQDQRIWVNNENHCYVPDGEFGTREVSEGTLKIKVVNIGEKRPVTIWISTVISIRIPSMWPVVSPLKTGKNL
jgi:hypothetical protein